MTNRRHNGSDAVSGFTLVEIMIVVAIISLLTVIAVPAMYRLGIKSRATVVANDLRVFGEAFATYAAFNGNYPQDSHETLPPGADMETYLDANRWYKETPLGGHYNWEGPDSYPYAGISVWNTPVSDKEMLIVDNVIDNGDLSSGSFRVTPNGRYTFIVEE